MKKEYPILYSTPMVEAMLDDRKTKTRRVVKPQPIDNTEVDGNFYEGNHKGYVKVDGHPNWKQQFAFEFAKWKVGDILYVRESHYRYGHWIKDGISKKTGKQKWKFKAEDIFPSLRFLDNPPAHIEKNTDRGTGWHKRSSLFLPKVDSRIWLEVTDVRVERLQDITEADAIAEGIKKKPGTDLSTKFDYIHYGWNSYDVSAVVSFRTLWEKINGAESWLANPWIWVISFKVLSTTGKPSNL